MRSYRITFVVSLLFAVSPALAQSATEAKLPVRRVVLFKNGVGYFEHTGKVRGNQQVSINFTTAQLNDVLKSLTVLDLGKGRITGVSYNSTAPIEQRLGALHLPVGQNTTLAQFLSALRGARIEARSGGASATGRLLSVETREVKGKDDSSISVDVVSLVTDSGEVRNFELTPATSVRVLEHDLNEAIGRYFNVMASTRDQDVRRMSIGTAGVGERELFVSYISEVPVWKSTYRIVLPEKADAKPILQGWAIVDNTVGEDWKDVQLSLVTGAPQSFIEQLSTPYYARRPVVALPETAMMTPQTHEQTLDNSNESANAMPAAPNAKPSNSSTFNRQRIEMHPSAGNDLTYMAQTAPGVVMNSGGGYGNFNANGVAGGMIPVEHAIENQEAAAQAHDLGDLFEYSLKEPVTIRKDQSALVPIVQAHVDAEKVTLWSPSSRPMRAIWLTNSSGLTLDGGSFNILESNTFAGEGLMDPIKPDEKRLLSYAVDLGVVVEDKRDSERQRVSKVRIVQGTLLQITENREQRTYKVRNQDTTPREMVIEHPARAGVKFADDSPKPAESTVSFHRFKLSVEPKSTASLTVKEVEPKTVRYEVTNLTSKQIAFFVQEKTIDESIEKALRGILAQKDGIAALDAQIESHGKEIKSVFDDQQRVRENLKALKGSAEEKELTQRYTRQLNQQEDRVQTLRNEETDLHHRRDAAQAELDKTIEGLSMEVTL